MPFNALAVRSRVCRLGRVNRAGGRLPTSEHHVSARLVSALNELMDVGIVTNPIRTDKTAVVSREWGVLESYRDSWAI